MQVEFLGHAGVIITAGKMRVACDPWLLPRGAFHASWFQFPCNHHLWERDYRDLTAVAITHESPGPERRAARPVRRGGLESDLLPPSRREDAGPFRAETRRAA